MTITIKERIHLLHRRPLIPIFLLKSKYGDMFDIQEDSQYLAPRHKDLFKQSQRMRTGDYKKLIPLEMKTIMPNIEFANDIEIDGDFMIFLKKHQKIATKLTQLFFDQHGLHDLLLLIAYVRDRINPKLFYYSSSVALAHRKDTSTITADVFNAFPMNFISNSVVGEVYKNTVHNIKSSVPLVPPITGTYFDEEYRVAYFREDLGLNSHHWHWHIVNPFGFDKKTIGKDRRGELFLYMHQQMVARYNNERLCSYLPRVVPFYNFNDKIVEGYYPKLRQPNSSKYWSGRPSNLTWQDLNRPDDKFILTMYEMNICRSRIEQAIDSGTVLLVDQTKFDRFKDGTRLHHYSDLTDDILGNMVESNVLSPNPEYYGDLHGNGHILSAYIHDPNDKYMEPMAVMGDTATAVRDPLFFRWHGFIDEVFQKFKSSNRSPAYEKSDLLFENMIIQDIQLFEDSRMFLDDLTREQRGAIHNEFEGPKNKNKLHTFWMNSVVKTDGLDLLSDFPIKVNYKHLDHIPFMYKITVDNKKHSRKGTVRIFLALKMDENRVPLRLNEQRRLFLEMDRFVHEFDSGINTINRESTKSSVTVPLEQLFPESLVTRDPFKETDMYCNCGWPQHLLLPKGMVNGADFQLFVMVSDYEKDKVTINDVLKCKESSSYCGLKDSKYPDARSMGYPFDRAVDDDIFISNFVNGIPNAMVKDISIKFIDIVVDDPRNKGNFH